MKNYLTWKKFIAKEKNLPYFQKILTLIYKKRKENIIIYPEIKDIFNAFRFTEFNSVKVVILGQDPYFRYNQANGLSFSVQPNMPIPPSLLNIYKELKKDIPNFIIPRHGYLKSWAEQGVMLLNTILTVEEGKAYSHSKLGWEIFTDKVISILNAYRRRIIFLLWGCHAQKKINLINTNHHYILKASHPSPLSAHRGFFGCHHFSKVNSLLIMQNRAPIDWEPKLLSD